MKDKKRSKQLTIIILIFFIIGMFLDVIIGMRTIHEIECSPLQKFIGVTKCTDFETYGFVIILPLSMALAFYGIHLISSGVTESKRLKRC